MPVWQKASVTEIPNFPLQITTKICICYICLALGWNLVKSGSGRLLHDDSKLEILGWNSSIPFQSDAIFGLF